MTISRHVFTNFFLPRFATIALPQIRRTASNSIASTNERTSLASSPPGGIINRPSYYSEPSFFKYFNTFIADNGWQKNVSNELSFRYKQASDEFIELCKIIAESANGDDADFAELATRERDSLIDQLIELQQSILRQAIVDDHDITECTLEFRAGVGGKEATLFAEELSRLYRKFIEYNGWEIRAQDEAQDDNQIHVDDNTSLWTTNFDVIGPQCYRTLRHESGVHRVQRIPKTEKHGRVHTSTVSLSVIPVRHNLVQVRDSDLKFDVKNSSGAGGQNVNRNLTCVRCTHAPTGLTVESQETRFQYLNKEIAIRKMKALLNQREYERLEREAREQKRLQIGIAARSDKIRTYNFAQNRITDHRLSGNNSADAIDDEDGGGGGGGGANLYNIIGYMAGTECNKMMRVIARLETMRQAQLDKQIRSAFEQSFLRQSAAVPTSSRKLS